MSLHFDRSFSHHQANDGKNISHYVASLNRVVIVHDLIKFLYYIECLRCLRAVLGTHNYLGLRSFWIIGSLDHNLDHLGQ